MDQATLSNLFAIFSLITYIAIALPLYSIAKKTGSSNPWFAFIPILSLWLMLDIAGKDAWWMLLMMIPVVNTILSVIIWMEIAEAMDKPSWLGFLMLIPVVNFLVPYYIAYA